MNRNNITNILILAIISILALAVSSCSKEEPITPSVKSLISLNNMSHDKVVKEIKKSGWNRIGIEKAEGKISGYIYKSKDFDAEIYVYSGTSDKSDSAYGLVAFQTQSISLYSQWRSELEEMGFKISEVVNDKYGVIYNCKSDSPTAPVFTLYDAVNLATPGVNVNSGDIYSLSIKSLSDNPN